MTVLHLSFRARFASALACAFLTIAAPVGAEQAPTVLAHAYSGPLRCEIQENDNGDMVELIGVAGSSRPIAGSAQLNIAKSGASGASSTDQSQDFSLQADQQAIVGRATTNLGLGGRVAVDLHLRAGGLECRAQASLER